MKKQTKAYISFVILSLAVGALSALLTREGMNLFDEIAKPPLTPPAVVFPIVWSVLYILMGLGAARIYTREPQSAASKLFTANLVLNFCWSLIFFNRRTFGLAFVWLLLLLGVVVAMTLRFYRIDKTAAIMQLPYCIWLVFAGYLNLFIFLAN